MWATGWPSACCLGEHDNKLLQRALITPHERSTNTVEEIFGCCKMSLLSSVHDTLLFLFSSLLSLLLSVWGWKVSTNHFLPSALLFSSFSLSVQTHLCVPATSSLPYATLIQLRHFSQQPPEGYQHHVKNTEPFPCSQESQALQGGESGQSNRGHQVPGTNFKQIFVLGQILNKILNRNILYAKIILYSPGEVKNKIQEFCQLLQ